MDAWVRYRGPSGPILLLVQSPDPPPKRYTFTDQNGMVVEADLVEVKEGVPFYQEVGMPNPPASD